MNSLTTDKMDPGPERLDALVARYASDPIPPVPGNLESRVWREIRARRAQANPAADWLARLLSWWREPRVALAGLVAVATIGIGMGWSNAAAAQVSSTQRALDLGVFSLDAPALPSTLLARAAPTR